jgi:hypothetical protein
MKNPYRLFLWLTVLGAVILCLPQINFYDQLSQGDHGRDLYAAQAALRGELPYQDYWWVYGPLMPYYFALFYKLTGGTIVSFLIGKLVLKVLCALFFYLGAATLIAPSIAFLGAMWFTQSQQDFFFTFNHLGGITVQMAILFFLFSYIKNQNLKQLWIALGLVFVYCLIKINFGLAALLAVLAAAAGSDFIFKTPFSAEKKKFYVAALGLPVAVFIVYWLLLKNLPFYAIRQCMPYFGDDQPHHLSPLQTIPYYFSQHWFTFIHHPLPLTFGLIIHSGTIISAYLLLKHKITGEYRTRLLLCLALLGVYFVLNFHEFAVSGVWYRSFWSLPFTFVFHIIMMATAFAILPVIVRRVIWVFFIVMMLLGVVASFFGTAQRKIPPAYLGGPHGKVYLGNEYQWTQTVNAVSSFLNENLKDDELFFALPYDCIYYYMTEKPSPTRQLIFFDHIKIPTEQEISIIKDLKNKKVKYVLISNRMASPELGLGTFGKTYCPLLYSYIMNNFEPHAREGGDWQKDPGWGHNHGVMIFKRKSPQPVKD